MKFQDIHKFSNIYLYAGDGVEQRNKDIPFIGLSLYKSDHFNIQHDITKPIHLPDNCVDIFQSEDVMEHIEYKYLLDIFNEIYRILKPGGLFRFSVPDFNSPIIFSRCVKDASDNIIYDTKGGGRYDETLKKVVDGGHVWFPTYNLVNELFQKSKFTDIQFMHYFKNKKDWIVKKIDYTKGYISRTPDHDPRVKTTGMPLSLVVDVYK